MKTDLFLYQFVDGHLFRISAWFATDLFHLVSEAVLQKYGPPTHEIKQPRELVWENNVSQIILTRGTVHPRTYSTLHLVHKQQLATVESRTPEGDGRHLTTLSATATSATTLRGNGCQALLVPLEHFARFEVEHRVAGGRPFAALPGENRRRGPQIADRFDVFHVAAVTASNAIVTPASPTSSPFARSRASWNPS